MTLSEPPTAIFCANDRTAWGAYNALAELGLRIPDDVAIIGFDNQIIIAEALRPALTSMELPHYAMGRWAADYLVDQSSENNSRSEQVNRLACPLIYRASVQIGWTSSQVQLKMLATITYALPRSQRWQWLRAISLSPAARTPNLLTRSAHD